MLVPNLSLNLLLLSLELRASTVVRVRESVSVMESHASFIGIDHAASVVAASAS